MDGKPRLGVVVVHLVLDVEVDAAQDVDEIGESVRVERHILMDGDAEKIRQRLHHRRSAAVRVEIGCTYLAALLRQLHDHIGRHRDGTQTTRRIFHAEEQDRVGVLPFRTVLVRTIVNAEHEDVRVAVKLRIDVTVALLSPLLVALVDGVDLLINAVPDAVEKVACDGEHGDEYGKEEHQHEEACASDAAATRLLLALQADVFLRAAPLFLRHDA